jgi:hypothetical protein
MIESVDAATLTTVASIIAAFGIAMLFFRIQRELYLVEQWMKERTSSSQSEQSVDKPIIWLAFADWLLVGATLICLLLVILPITFSLGLRLPAAASAAAIIMVAGYVFAILGHYRIVFGQNRSGGRSNPEPWELFFVTLVLVVALAAFVLRLMRP